jgi:hypothetical protein
MGVLQRWSSATSAWVDIDNNTTLICEQVIGFDAPPVATISQPYGQGVGDVYQRTRVEGRAMTAILVAYGAAGVDALYTVKDALAVHMGIDIYGNFTDAPIILRYNGRATPLQITAYYAGGLEGTERLAPNVERIALRFYCPSPTWATVP